MAEQGAAPVSTQNETDLAKAVLRFLTPRPTQPTPRDLELIEQGSPIVLDCGLAATAWGEGPTVLLAHGWESRRSHWSSFVTPLVQAGFRAVAIDAPAHGDSPGETSNMPLYARMMLDAGRQLGPLEGVVGHSFGAGAATMALSQGLAARRAVLIAGAATIMTYMNRWCRSNGIEDSRIPQFVAMTAEAVGQPAEGFDLTLAASRNDLPALVVHDKTDDDVPVEDAYAIAAAWPGARLLVTERYGHKRILIAKPVVQEVMRFLTEGRGEMA